MNQPPCFMCRRAAEWQGKVGTLHRYACSEHQGMIELLKRRHPFQSTVRLVPSSQASVGRAMSRPVELVPSDVPGRDNFSGDAA